MGKERRWGELEEELSGEIEIEGRKRKRGAGCEGRLRERRNVKKRPSEGKKWGGGYRRRGSGGCEGRVREADSGSRGKGE